MKGEAARSSASRWPAYLNTPTQRERQNNSNSTTLTPCFSHARLHCDDRKIPLAVFYRAAKDDPAGITAQVDDPKKTLAGPCRDEHNDLNKLSTVMLPCIALYPIFHIRKKDSITSFIISRRWLPTEKHCPTPSEFGGAASL